MSALGQRARRRSHGSGSPMAPIVLHGVEYAVHPRFDPAVRGLVRSDDGLRNEPWRRWGYDGFAPADAVAGSRTADTKSHAVANPRAIAQTHSHAIADAQPRTVACTEPESDDVRRPSRSGNVYERAASGTRFGVTKLVRVLERLS
jgi:hypothetical protein